MSESLAPAWFLKELKAFDPELRLRWSHKMNLWQLERKIAHGKIIDTSKTDYFDDDYTRAREGYILVALIEPDKFSRNIFSVLRASDLWSNGGWETVAAHIEEMEAREEAQKWEAFSDEVKYQAKEFYDFLQFREGSRIINIGMPK
jgi:hypothetical protein